MAGGEQDKARAEARRESFERFAKAEATLDVPEFRAFVEFLAGAVKVKAGGVVYTYPRPNLAMLALWTLRIMDFADSVTGAARLRYALEVQKNPDKLEPLFRGEWPRKGILRTATELDGLDSYGYLFGFKAVVDFVNETAKKKAQDQKAEVVSEASPKQ